MTFIASSVGAIALAGVAYPKWRQLEKHYEDEERREDTLHALKDTQVEEQLQYLETAAESKRFNEQADQNMERQLKVLEQTAPIFSEILKLTGQQGPVVRMALGMIQNGSSLGEALTATADAEMQMEQARLSAQLQQRQIELQVQTSTQQLPQASQSAAVAASPQVDAIAQLQKAAAVVGVKTECVKIDKAPSYQRLIFGLRTVDYALLPKWKKAAKLALGKDEDLPMYVYSPEQIAVEVGLKPEERTFYDLPTRQWKRGDRLVVLGQSLDGEVAIDLGNEDTPQALVVGTTGSGKSNFLRSAAYSLLMQGARVDICGGKVSDYEDFAERFPSISVNDMGKAFEYVGEYYIECDRRNSMSKAELAQQEPWILLIDEYKGTVPFDEKRRKLYDDQLCEVTRRGRGLKIHVILGIQHGSKRSKDDPQGLPPDLRANLPARIAFRCIEAIDGRMVLHKHGEIVTSLQGRGDGIIQAGQINTRFQAYRFERIPG
ncbi:MAG: FtsK/SpoIIIE domain-containing protein [Gloeotrichia echinulata HAB0833]